MFESIREYVQPQADKIGLYIEDLDSGNTLDIHGDRSFSSASAIKYPVMWAYYELVSQGKIDPQTVHPLQDSDRVGETPYDSGVLRELHTGIPLTYEDCIKFMIVISDDVATNIILKLVGMEHCNQVFRRLGLTGTSCHRLMMDYAGLEAGRDNFISARDMGRLSHMICTNELLPERYNREMLAILCNCRHNDALPRYLPRTIRVGHKGGCITQYGMDHDVGILFDEQRPRLLVNVCTQYADQPRELIGTVARMAYEEAVGKLP